MRTQITNIKGLSFSAGELLLAAEDGRVSRRRHNEYPYSIYNYTDEVQFSNTWDDITRTCRGLILDDNFNIIARPWKKFFNLGQMPLEIGIDDPATVMDKADGSLGILYRTPEGGRAVATRGSFHSEQAEHATKLWNTKYSEYYSRGDFTPLFEIVYKANRIVLDYGEQDDLILLGAVDIITGDYLEPKIAKHLFVKNNFISDYPGPVVEVFPYKSLREAVEAEDRINAEGFVVQSGNYMVKIKQEDYLQLHRLRFNMNPKRIWEALFNGEDLREMVKPLPDEFQQEILDVGDALTKGYISILAEISNEWNTVCHIADRREFALTVKNFKHKPAMFSILDFKDISPYVWKLVKPKGEKT